LESGLNLDFGFGWSTIVSSDKLQKKQR